MGALAAAGLSLIGVTVVTDTAVAASLPCGSVITSSTTLTEDMTCPNGPGLIVMGSGVTLKLNGHTISAGPLETRHVGPYDLPGGGVESYEYDVSFTRNDDAGIVVMGDGHTIKGPGTLTHFGAGLMLINANGNTVDGVTAHENIGVPGSEFFGDGIIVNNSNNNVIKNSTVTNNGHYSGITLLGASTGNKVSDTLIRDNNHPELCGAEDQNFTSQGVLYNYCGPNTQNLPVWGATIAGESRPAYSVVFQQNMGFRFEGEGPEGAGATDNLLISSTITGSGNHGVLFGAYCNDPNCEVPGGEGNVRNTVQANKINANGFGSSYGPPRARMFGGPLNGGSGILWFIPSCGTPSGSGLCPGNPNEHPPGRETVIGNEVNGNARHGLSVSYSEGNDIQRNKAANNNAASGGTAASQASFNAQDLNGTGADRLDKPCGTNIWQWNGFGDILGAKPPNASVNQPCVANKPPKGSMLDHGPDPGVSGRAFSRGHKGAPEAG